MCERQMKEILQRIWLSPSLLMEQDGTKPCQIKALGWQETVQVHSLQRFLDHCSYNLHLKRSTFKKQIGLHFEGKKLY